jgi:hypothetical protein
MSFDYSGVTTTAANTIRQFGQLCSISYEVGEVINKATGVITTPATVTTYTAYGVSAAFNSNDIDGETILRNDMKLIMETKTVAPEAGYSATVNGVKYKIVNVNAVEPSGSNIIYILQLRK